MEDSHFRVQNLPESNFVFPPRCRLRLRSETYRTLVRILSQCYEDADISLTTEIDPQELRAACSSHLRQATEEAPSEQVVEDFRSPESGDSVIKKDMAITDSFEMTSVGDVCFHETEIKLDDIHHTRTDCGDATNDQNISGASSEPARGKNHPYEIEHTMEGNEMIAHDNNINAMRTSDHKIEGNHRISPEKQVQIDDQQVMVEEGESIVEKLSGTTFSLDGDKIRELSKPNDHNQEIELSAADEGMHQQPENQPKEMELKDIVCEHDSNGSHVLSSEIMEVEDGEQCREKVSEADLMCLDKDMSCEDHKQSKNTEDKATPMVVDASKEIHEMFLKGTQMDKLPRIPETMGSPNCMTETEDMEEGEICGDDGVTDGSACTILEGPILLTENEGDILVSEESLDRQKFPSVQANGNVKKHASFFPDMAEYASHENKEDFKQIKSSMEACERGVVVSGKVMRSEKEDQQDFMLEERRHKIIGSENKNKMGSFAAYFSNQVVHDQVPDANAARCKEKVSTEKETGACNKKKRGPISEGRKARKKIKERKKRAEKNRKLGVKRLKLHPVTVPKPIVYCRHYLKGRCHEGDQCKFSHDTIPLTKSTPCSHFARHSCMKGDDCPFDHQLSKYPCTNFVSKGSCSRGDACLFSHKVLGKEESTSTPSLKTELRTPQIPSNSDSQKKPNGSSNLKQNLVALPNYGTSRHNTPQSENLPKKTAGPPPIGINFLSFGTPSAALSKIKSDHLSQENNLLVEGGNVLNQGGFCSVGNLNEPSRKILPETPPKGVNFLSFGITSQDDSSNKKLGTLSSYENGTRQFQKDNATLAISKTNPFSNDMLKKVETATSKQMNISFPKALVGNYAPDGLVSSSSNGKVSSDLPVQARKDVDSERESSSAILPRLQGTPVSSGQFSCSLDSSRFKGRSSSAQKALFSTLAFAAKYDSLMTKNKADEGSNGGRNENINKSIGSPAESISGSLKNDQAKAAKLLDFLLGVRDKS